MRDEIPSLLGRLLAEISWEGNAKIYREGGRGRENVLTAEVLQALDYLPREHFFGAVVKSMNGAKNAREILGDEIENAKIDLLHGDILLKPSAKSWQQQIPVQPDGIIVTDNIYAVIEAKRIKSSSFQSKQLARELYAAHKESGLKLPLLILITGSEPPYRVDKHGKIDIKNAIELYMSEVIENESDSADNDLVDRLIGSVSETVYWITWESIAQIVEEKMQEFHNQNASVVATVERLSRSILMAVDWHS